MLTSGNKIRIGALLYEAAVRIVKHLGPVPCVAACTACGKQFTTPQSTLQRVREAQANLQQQFARHKHENEGPRRGLSSSRCGIFLDYKIGPAPLISVRCADPSTASFPDKRQTPNAHHRRPSSTQSNTSRIV